MAKPKSKRCILCDKPLPKGEQGYNPEPVVPYSSGTCCNECFRLIVLKKRKELEHA